MVSFGYDEDDEELFLNYTGLLIARETIRTVLHWVSVKCSTKPLSRNLTRILTAVKVGLQQYCNISSASKKRCQSDMAPENSKELLQTLQSLLFCSENSKKIDPLTLCTTIPQYKLKSRAQLFKANDVVS